MKTVINIKTDKEIKEKAQDLARELGVPLSTLVNATFGSLFEPVSFLSLSRLFNEPGA